RVAPAAAARRASLVAMAAGADFIKTSTGKISPAATLPVTLCMLEAIRDVHVETGWVVGMKPAGGTPRCAREAGGGGGSEAGGGNPPLEAGDPVPVRAARDARARLAHAAAV